MISKKQASSGSLLMIGAAVGIILGGAALVSQDAFARSERTSGPSMIYGAPFTPLQPTRLPPGTTLLVAHTRTHDNGITGDVDLHYSLPNGWRLHIWQTNRSPEALGSKNPLAEAGVVHRHSLASWLALPAYDGRALSLNALVNGRIVSVDAALPVAELIAIAESLR